MPKIIGKKVTVVEHDGLTIDEVAGNAATPASDFFNQSDTVSIAHVTVAHPTAEPWLTLDYDEWICLLKGTIEMKYMDGETEKTLTVNAGETCFVEKGERFRPVFPKGGAEYIPVCVPAFKPERCKREEDEETSKVTARLRELHKTNKKQPTSNANVTTLSSFEIKGSDILYHMCQKSLWEQAVQSGKAYFPPTYEKDGGFTHATAVPARLVSTANHFYTGTKGDWICLELSMTALHYLGIVTRFEEPKPVGETPVANEWNEWRCPHIFGGLPTQADGVVLKVHPMEREGDGHFLGIPGLTM